MKIGYVGMNTGIGCTAGSTFRLASYSPERLTAAVENNLSCLEKILRFNAEHDILFFRITSSLVPFASHEACTFPWQTVFGKRLKEIGRVIERYGMRISMHPGSYNVLNAPDRSVVDKCVRELVYHAEVLDLLGLDLTAKVQIHVGGVYGDKRAGIERFGANFRLLPGTVRRRLAVENDGTRYTAAECRAVHEMTGIPVIFDVLHHEQTPDGTSAAEAFTACASTWKPADGIPMVDFGTQKKGAVAGAHASLIDVDDLALFLAAVAPLDCDVMMESKSKEASALKAVEALREDPRFVTLKKHAVR